MLRTPPLRSAASCSWTTLAAGGASSPAPEPSQPPLRRPQRRRSSRMTFRFRVQVGFVMLSHDVPPGNPEAPWRYFLWRFLIDRRHQRRGIGGRSLDLVEAEMQARGDSNLFVSWAEGKGSPGPMYISRGYKPTGEVHGGEIEAKKPLT